MVIDRQRLAMVLWIVWAAIVWNVVFDRVLVVAGREYVRSAWAAAGGSGPYARIDDRMRPAVSRAFWAASAAAGVIVAIGCAAVRLAARTPQRVSPAGTPWAQPPTR
jgi:ABC-type Fe3+ transport system permease subunit